MNLAGVQELLLPGLSSLCTMSGKFVSSIQSVDTPNTRNDYHGLHCSLMQWQSQAEHETKKRERERETRT